MKKYAVWILIILLLSGCTGPPNEMERGVELRSKLLQSSRCTFTATITADYGDKIHTFTMNCESDSKGNLAFTVIQPESISGITGTLSGDGGNITFDDAALHFELMADNQLSPISAPWILLKTLRSGNMTSACTENENIRLSMDDSYEENPLRLDLWLNPENKPVQADILYDGRRVLSVCVANFEIL